MKILSKFKVRHVADEDIVLLQGRNPGDMTTVMSLNPTSLYLWNELLGRDFELADVSRLLLDRFDVDEATATADAQKWVDTLKQHNIIEG